MPTTSALRFTSLVQTFNRVRRVQLRAMLAWEGHIGQDISFALIHQFSALWPTDAQLAGDMPPCFDGMLIIRLVKRLPYGVASTEVV